jgi:hypothetical protein
MWDRLTAQEGIGGEAIIWLIIAFLWVVAQLVSRAKERARARELARQEPDQPDEQRDARAGQTFEREMRKFLETIGAEPAEEEELFPEPEPQPPPRPRVQRRPIRREPPPPPVHLVERRAEPPPPHVLAESRLGDMDTSIDESALDADRAYAVRETGQADSINAFVNPRTLLVNLNYLRMNMPLIPISGLDTTSEARPRPAVHGRKALRDAITTQIILSTPLAMGEDKASYTKRVV